MPRQPDGGLMRYSSSHGFTGWSSRSDDPVYYEFGFGYSAPYWFVVGLSCPLPLFVAARAVAVRFAAAIRAAMTCAPRPIDARNAARWFRDRTEA
jgi:hypothetical protein